MRILIDADGCPVVNQAIRLGNRAGLEVILLCDTSRNVSGAGGPGPQQISKVWTA